MISIIFITAIYLHPADLITIAESSAYTQTSLYSDVMEFLYEAQKRSGQVKIQQLTRSSEGRMIPLVIISTEGVQSPQEMNTYQKPAVLIVANIHAGEVEGKEASLMLIRDIVDGKMKGILRDQVLLMIPIFNADGNDKMGPNRRDNGPERAGVRYNGQHLDLNRDYLKLESPEVRALVRLFQEWQPVLFVDMHTTNGSYHREPVTYTTLANPHSDPTLIDYMWRQLFPEVQKTLKQTYGYDSIPYGNFVDRADPNKGWRNHAFAALYGNNYGGLRNIFTILNENYAYADFKTRVLASLGFIKSILQFTNQNIGKMEQIIRTANIRTREHFFKEKFVLDFQVDPLFDMTIKSYEFYKEKIKPEERDKYPPWIKDFIVKKRDRLKDYHVTYYAKAEPTSSLSLPEAYIVLPGQEHIIEKLADHGIIMEKNLHPFTTHVEHFIIKEIKPSERIYQGHVMIDIKGQYELRETTIPPHSYLVTMKQSLARLIPELLEPQASNSLIKWGYFNRDIVSQWTNRPGEYPVYRLPKMIQAISLIKK